MYVRSRVVAKLGMGGKREDGGYGDYDTPEETFPDKPIPGTRTWNLPAVVYTTVTCSCGVLLLYRKLASDLSRYQLHVL